MHIVTVATESKYYFPYLKESCRRHGKELDVLGWGEKWQGFNWRYVKMIEYLKTKSPNDVVCFVDGYDVLCVRDLNDMEEVFKNIQKRTNCKLVVSQDISMKPIFSFIGKLYFGKCKNMKLNAGLYMGYVKDVLIIIEKIYNSNPKNDADDQVLMTKYCNMNNDLYIDKDKELFFSICYSLKEIDKYIVYDNGVVYEGGRPFFVHATAYGYLDNMIIKLGYGECTVKNDLFNNYFEKKILFYLYYSIFNVYTIILLILLLIINNLNTPFLKKINFKNFKNFK
jgi:hypothetical protein